jgi:hypothetical protein
MSGRDRETVWAADQDEQRTVEAEDYDRVDYGRGVGDSGGPTWLDMRGD